MGKSVIELQLEFKNKITAGLTSAKAQVRRDVGVMRSEMAEFTSKSKAGFQSLANEVPMLGSNLRMLTNPIALTVAGVTALAVGFGKATDSASKFNTGFRELANLNLDKSRSEIAELKKMVLDTSWYKGFNSEQTKSAYNELQSTVGLYGEQARPIVEKQGEFATLMQADMNEYVAGTAKAMANWRFGVERLDDFNKSAYATMQVGVISFQELARVQAVYAGSAASINQDFDTANKLLSLFTIRTKSVEEAATQTKSLFNDLTKKTTIEAFRKVGINMYDSNKQLKQADVIMLELNKKFMTMKNDKAIVELKNRFTGSEGLIAMIQAATDKSGELKKMFDEFSNSKFNADSALLNAQADIVARQTKLTNKIDNLMIRMGNWMMPIKEQMVGVVESSVNYFDRHVARNDVTLSGNNLVNGALLGTPVGGLKLGYEYLIKPHIEDYQTEASNQRKAEIAKQKNHVAPAPIANQYTAYNNNDKSRAEYMKTQSEKNKPLYPLVSTSLLDTKVTPKGSATSPNALDTSTTGGDTVNRITGSAQAPKSIIVNIDAFNKGGINTQNTSLQKMDAKEIENWFVDVCMRAVRNVEMSY